MKDTALGGPEIPEVRLEGDKIISPFSHLPSWELTYPLSKAVLKMSFLFPRWDMLIPWRVNIFIIQSPNISFVFIIQVTVWLGGFAARWFGFRRDPRK